MIVSGNKSLVDSKFKNQKDIQNIYDKTRLAEPLITSDLVSLGDKINADFAGLKYSVKTASSIEDKIERTRADYKEAPDFLVPSDEKMFSNFTDVIRYTEIVQHDDIINKTKDTINELENKGYTLEKIKNYYMNPFPSTGYKGIHLNFISPYGQTFELQVHSNESFAAKQEGHELYEKIRSVSTNVENKEQLRKEIKQIHSSIPNPPEYRTLKNFRLSSEQIMECKNNCKKLNVRFQSKEANGINCLSYQILNEDKLLYSGIENHHSDGSVYLLKSNHLTNEASYASLTSTGNLAAQEKINLFKDININEAYNIAMNIEKQSNEWMKNFQSKENEIVKDNDTPLSDFIKSVDLASKEKEISISINDEMDR